MTEQLSPDYAGIPEGISREDVIQAMTDFEKGADHRFRDSTGYDLLHEEKRYPPKALLGLAARRLLGRAMLPGEFSGGESSRCFAILRALGFQILPKAPTNDLPADPTGVVWMEITKKDNKQGGPGWGLGECLWSPSRTKDGSDGYKTMREVQPGELVFHCCDSVLEGFSFAKASFQELTQDPPQPADWAGRAPYYRIELERYTPLRAALPLTPFLRRHEDELRQDILENRPRYYPFVEQAGNLITRQGGYLSRCTPRLYQLIQAAVSGDQATPLATQPVRDQRTQTLTTPEPPSKGSAGNGLLFLDGVSDRISQVLRVLNSIKQTHPANEAQIEMVRRSAALTVAQDDSVTVNTVLDACTRRLELSIVDFDRLVWSWLNDGSRDLQVRLESHAVEHSREADEGAIRQFFSGATVPGTPKVSMVRFSLDDVCKVVFLPRLRIDAVLAGFRRKKNVILQGPPGVGKSFIARRLAFAVVGAVDPTRVEMVQFHPSYAYEDFVRGWRPNGTGGFALCDGVFFRFCERARAAQPSEPFVFIIDEINRANLGKVFGELMLLIEHDKRGPNHQVSLASMREPNERFFVPENVHIMGLMNTADRSLAMVDYALRRRFLFFDLEPQFHTSLRVYLEICGVPTELSNHIFDKIAALNQAIAEEKDLGRGFMVGHSYFCPDQSNPPEDWEVWYDGIIEYEIRPLLREYWFDNEDKAEEWVAKLRHETHPH